MQGTGSLTMLGIKEDGRAKTNVVSLDADVVAGKEVLPVATAAAIDLVAHALVMVDLGYDLRCVVAVDVGNVDECQLPLTVFVSDAFTEAAKDALVRTPLTTSATTNAG